MKKTISIMLAAILCLSFISGCSGSGYDFFDFNVKKYVEVGEIFGVEYEEQSLDVTDADVDAYINYELSQKGYGEEKKITGRPVQNGDTVNIDFVGKKDGVEFEGGTAKGHDLVIGSNSFIEGFESGLVGAKIGQTLDLNLRFPENYGNEELKGAAVVFTVTVNSIKKTIYPELTDDIAKELNAECATVKEYKTYVIDALEQYNKESIQADNESQVWTYIIQNAKLLKFPESEREFAKEMALKTLDQKYYYQAGVTFQDAVKQSGLTMDDAQVVEIINTESENIMKEFLVVLAIARDQDLDVTPEEYQQKLEQTAKERGYSNTEEFKKTIDEKQFYLSLLNIEVTNLIMENAVKTN